MTALSSQASQASHFWDRAGAYTIESDHGYLICAVSSFGHWSFVASGPKIKIKRVPQNEPEYFNSVEYKAHYSIGDIVPPSFGYREREAREHIGTFNQRDHGGTDQARNAAKAACHAHLNKSKVLPELNQSGPGNPHFLASDSGESLPNTSQGAST